MILSIIVPIYNSEKSICRCLDSILSQSFTDFELLLVDDCSTDKSGSICNEYARRDSRIIVYHNSINKGVSYSRNYGLTMAMGKWIMFIDSDDWIDINYISDVVSNSDADLVVSSFTYNGENIYKVPIATKQYDLVHIRLYLEEYSTRFTSPWAKLYKNTIIKEYNIKFDENISHGEDTIFLYDYIAKSQSIETKAIHGYFYSCDLVESLSKKVKPLNKYIDIINALNQRIEILGIKYSWCCRNARLELTEYFLSRYLQQLLKGDLSFKKQVEEIRILFTVPCVKEVMCDMHYLPKGRKRKIFDWLVSHSYFRSSVLLLFLYAKIGATI